MGGVPHSFQFSQKKKKKKKKKKDVPIDHNAMYAIDEGLTAADLINSEEEWDQLL